MTTTGAVTITMKMKTYFGIAILMITSKMGISQLCTGGEIFGEANPVDRTGNVDSAAGNEHMLSSASHNITCCGTTRKWSVAFNTAHGKGTVFFQIWRPLVGTTSYTLMSEFGLKLNAPRGTRTKNLPPKNRITVLPGDKVGWSTSGSGIVTYNSNAPLPGGNLLISLPAPAVGQTHDWSSATVENDRAYGLNMQTEANTAPFFTNTIWSKTLTDPAPGTFVVTISVSDPDVYDITYLDVTLTSHPAFTIDPITKIISTSSTMYMNSTEDLEFVVTDLCGNTKKATYTVNVIILTTTTTTTTTPATTTTSPTTTTTSPTTTTTSPTTTTTSPTTTTTSPTTTTTSPTTTTTSPTTTTTSPTTTTTSPTTTTTSPTTTTTSSTTTTTSPTTTTTSPTTTTTSPTTTTTSPTTTTTSPTTTTTSSTTTTTSPTTTTTSPITTTTSPTSTTTSPTTTTTSPTTTTTSPTTTTTSPTTTTTSPTTTTTSQTTTTTSPTTTTTSPTTTTTSPTTTTTSPTTTTTSPTTTTISPTTTTTSPTTTTTSPTTTTISPTTTATAPTTTATSSTTTSSAAGSLTTVALLAAASAFVGVLVILGLVKVLANYIKPPARETTTRRTSLSTQSNKNRVNTTDDNLPAGAVNSATDTVISGLPTPN